MFSRLSTASEALIVVIVVVCCASITRAVIVPTGDVSPTYSGVDDPWVMGSAYIGSTGDGRLDITGGSVIHSDDAYLGYQSGASGTVDLDGPGSAWHVNDRIYVGNHGSGELTTRGGGSIDAAGINIGQWEGSSGSATVTGAGSSWEVSDFLFVGNYGPGTLLVETGATINSNYRVILGVHDGVTGTATITGAGSSWRHDGEFNLGWGGTIGVGTLDIFDGALVEVGGYVKIHNPNSTVNLGGGTLRLYDSGFESPLPMPPAASLTGGNLNFTGGRLEGASLISMNSPYVQRGGVLAPGNAIGETIIGGGATLESGTLEIEVGGEGGSHDLLVTVQDMQIQGNGMTLDLKPIGPMAAGTYTIIQTQKAEVASITGSFGSTIGLGLIDGLIDVQYTDDTVTVTLNWDYVPGDLNADGFVGIDDLNAILGNWDQSVPAGSWGDGDPSGDGFVGIEDLNLVLSHWNAGTPPTAEALGNVPEPGAAVLFGLMVAGMVGRGRRARSL